MVDEGLRLAALREYRLLDGPADAELAAVVRVAAAVAGVPTATVNLLETDRQCQLVTTGFEGGDSARRDSLCEHALHSGSFVHVPDARLDPRCAGNPWVTGALAEVRLYAAAPLVTSGGHVLGTLCVFDSRPGELSAEQVARLEDLAAVVVALFERRRQARATLHLAAEAEEQRALAELTLVELEARHVELAERGAELERSNAELEHFAAVASHDLNSPLTVVAGYLELLEEDYAPLLDDGAREYIATALRSVGRMTALIHSLLGYAQSGSATTRREFAGVGELAGQALLDLRSAVQAAGARVVVDELPEVWCDPTLVRQLLQNLVANAVTYRHPDRDCTVRVAGQEQDGQWVFEVTDNGVGIPAEQRNHVFAMFARVDAASRDGHGIGLATCQRIVDRHGGRIWAEESLGGGTRMRFTLPQRTAGRLAAAA
jgi:signal transduction histidine kinase